jgi:PAS domain S-box-containing protein
VVRRSEVRDSTERSTENSAISSSADALAYVRDISERLRSTKDIAEVFSILASSLGSLVSPCRVLIFRLSSMQKSAQITEWHQPDIGSLSQESLVSLVKEFRGKAMQHPGVLQFRAQADGPRWAQAVRAAGATFVLAQAIRHVENPVATIVLLRSEEHGAWTKDDLTVIKSLTQAVAATISQRALSSVIREDDVHANQNTSASHGLYQRLIEQANALLFHADGQHRIRYINQRALEFFGVPPEDFVAGEGVCWTELLHVADREKFRSKLSETANTRTGIEEEARILNHITGAERWILIRYTPFFSEDGAVIGWDGFATDTTRRREAQQALASQSKRVRALYSVSSAIRGYFDTVNIASGGLAALCEATGADAAFCFVAHSSLERPQLIAHHGLSARCLQEFERSKNIPAVAAYVADDGAPAVIDDLRTDPRASSRWAEEEGLRSAVVVPIRLEDTSLGTIGLFHKEGSHFSSADVMLVSAAANQIGLAARQANLFTAYRKQTRNLAALYRLSHELSGSQSLEQIFNRAFSIIRDEIGVKRLWLGLLNETGTRIIGQGAMGPGWKRRLVEMNVEVIGRDHPIAQVVNTRKPRVLTNPEEILDEFGVKRFFSRFSFNAIGLIPLVAAGQLLGVLAFQPSSAKKAVQEEEMTLLGSLASEIAAAILAKRFDDRVAEAEKMRTAGLLAAGIAHNFNNLLQAILGQASLLELQQLQPAQITRAASIINDAAAKGATLVRQLMSFAHLEEALKEVCDVNAVLERASRNLSRNLRSGQEVVVKLGENLPTVFADSTQVMRILSSLVANASEASPENSPIEIFSDSIVVTRETPHFEVPYGKYVRIGVRDNGVGMDDATRRRCFEPFFTTKDVDPGSGLSMTGAGLGLAAAFALARKNGGRLVVDSRKGHGSVFTLYLPVATAVERGETSLTSQLQPVVERESKSTITQKTAGADEVLETESHVDHDGEA